LQIHLIYYIKNRQYLFLKVFEVKKFYISPPPGAAGIYIFLYQKLYLKIITEQIRIPEGV